MADTTHPAPADLAEEDHQRHYRTNYQVEGSLRQLRSSLQAIRERYADQEMPFALWMVSPGMTNQTLSVGQFCTSFLLRRHEKRYRKGHHGRCASP